MARRADDEFDLDAYRLTPERAAEIAKARKQTQPKRARLAEPEAFVMLPYGRTLAAAGRLGDAPMAVLVELAHQHFKTHRNVIPLANAAFRKVGISPDAKVRALRQLGADGMVSVDWRGGRKTPYVRLLWIT